MSTNDYRPRQQIPVALIMTMFVLVAPPAENRVISSYPRLLVALVVGAVGGAAFTVLLYRFPLDERSIVTQLGVVVVLLFIVIPVTVIFIVPLVYPPALLPFGIGFIWGSAGLNIARFYGMVPTWIIADDLPENR